MAKTVRAGAAAIVLEVMDRVDKGLKSATRKMKKWGGGLMKAGAALTGGIVGLMGGPVLLASRAEESMAKFNTVFGESADVMSKWSKTTAAALGTSRTEMSTMLGSMQDLLVPMGLMEGTATDMTKGLSTLAVDLASFNNMNTQDTFRDMMAAMTGSSEVLAKYGVVVNETLKKQEAMNLGISDGKGVLTPAQKAMATYSLIMKGTTAAQGDAIRTQDSFANQLKRLKANAIDIGTAVGMSLLGPLSAVGKVINTVALNVKDWIDANPGLVKGIGMAAAVVGGLGVSLLALGGTLTVIGMAMGGIAAGLGLILSPLGLIIGGIAVAITMVAKWTNFFGDALAWLSDRFGPLVETVKNSMVAIQEAFATGNLTKAWDLTVQTLEVIWLDLTIGIRESWYAMLNKMSELTVPFVEGIGKMFQKLADFLRKIMDKYKNYYNAVYNWVTEKIGEATGVRTIGGPVDAFGGSALDTFTANLANSMDQFGQNIEDSAQGMHEDRVARRAARIAELKNRKTGLMENLATEAETAKAAKEAREKLTADAKVGPIQNMLGGLGGGLTGAAGGGPTGTFSAAGAALQGGQRGFQGQLLKLQKDSLQQQQAIAENTKNNVAKVGK